MSADRHAGAAFVEIYFVMSSLFASRAYYAFGFLAMTALVVGLTVRLRFSSVFETLLTLTPRPDCNGHHPIHLLHPVRRRVQMAVAVLPHWRRQRFLAIPLWVVLLGLTTLVGLAVECGVVPGVLVPACFVGLFGNRYVLPFCVFLAGTNTWLIMQELLGSWRRIGS